MEGRHARRPVRGIEIIAAHDDDRYPIAPGVVDRHGGVLQTDGAMDERQQRLARHLEIAVPHGHCGFLMHAGEEFRHLVLTVVDQRLVDGAIARGGIGGQILDVERLDHVDHEVGTGDAADPRQVLRDAGFRRSNVHRGRQRGRPRRRRRGGSGRLRGRLRSRRGHRSGRTRHRDAGEELAAADIGTPIISFHGFLPLNACRDVWAGPRRGRQQRRQVRGSD